MFSYFGGKNPVKDFKKLSNVIFSNGDLDPWHAGGVTFELNNTTKTIYIENSAHHFDLREPNSTDPESVKLARAEEIRWVAKFID